MLDYFAGSGSTAQAAIEVARETSTRLGFILVEMGGYLDSVILPRVAKVTYSPVWQDGVPGRVSSNEEARWAPRIVKVMRLETFDDALHNVTASVHPRKAGAQEALYKDTVGSDEYRLRYLLKLPIAASDTLLSLSKLEHPFDYEMEVLTDSGPRKSKVDLIETFNWLYGLRVQKLATWVNRRDVTKGTPREDRVVKATDREQKRRILVVWRDMTDLKPEAERTFLEARLKDQPVFDEVLINGDAAVPRFASLDGLFKRLMEAPE